MSFEDFEYCLEFLERSGMTELKLLGGEPTTHPEFCRFVDAGLDRGFSVMVFTNGLWSPSVKQFVRKTDTTALSFLFNVNEPGLQPERETVRQAEPLRIAGPRGMIGFNLYQAAFNLGFLPALIDTFSLKREVRLGVAHPIAGQDNACLSDQELPLLGARLLEQLDALEKRNILGSLDCGFPLCMFPEKLLSRLVTHVSPGSLSVCHPIIDVGVGLTAWPCFPLSGLLNVNLRDYKKASDLIAFYEARLSALRGVGFRDDCLDCKYRLRGQCCGGCLARTIRNWRGGGDQALLEKLA